MPRGKNTAPRRKNKPLEPQQTEENQELKKTNLKEEGGECHSNEEKGVLEAGASKTADESNPLSKYSTEDSNKEEDQAMPSDKGSLKEMEKKVKKITILNYESDKSAPKRPVSNLSKKEMKKIEGGKYFWKLHNAGKSWQAKADLPRLAIIRQEREEAAKRRDEEKKRKEEAKNKEIEEAQQKKLAQVKKTLGKKSA